MQKSTKTNGGANFLRRGEAASHRSALPVEPSFVLDEGNSSAATGAAGSVGGDRFLSQQPSQLTQLGLTQEQFKRLPRQRPRFHTVQDLDLALNQAIEGKITIKNAWASKEASDLLEGITHTIQSTLEANTADDYSGFAKAATVVEGCSKVWTSRVDSTYNRSNQMVQRLLRNDVGEGADGDGDGSGSGDGSGAGEDSRGGAAGARANKQKARALVRTLAMDETELNLDRKAKTALTQTGVNAQFRAITERFDQGNAQGLLMNNAPMGREGNIILDVDYSVVHREFSAKKAKQMQKLMGTSSTRSSRGSTTAARSKAVKSEYDEDDEDAEEDDDAVAEEHRLEMEEKEEAQRRRSLRIVEYDTAIHTIPTDLPRALPFVEMNSGTTIATSASASAAARASGGSAVDALLVLSHSAMKTELRGEAEAPAAATGSSSNEESGGVAPNNMFAGTYDDQYNDDDGGGGDGGYDDDGYGGESAEMEEESGTARGSGFGASAGLSSTISDAGATAARQLVSGAAEMQSMDTLFLRGGMAQLALEAEDPSSWCPLSELPRNPLANALPHSELSRLRREHHIGANAQQKGLQQSAAAAAPSARVKKERTVVFHLPDEKQLKEASTISFNKAEVDGSALKQSATATKNITSLGREILLGKDVAHAVLSYTQSSFQKEKAEQAGIVLTSDPVPGVSIPRYLPYPVDIASFFQPYCTPLSEWNLLRKSATGQLINSNGSVAAAAAGAGPTHGKQGEGLDGEDTGMSMQDMPVEFFPGGAEVDDGDDGGYDHYDYGTGGGDDDYDTYAAESSLAERQLLTQFERQAAAAAEEQFVAASARASTLRASRGSLTDPLEMAHALQTTEATIPNQVDVVKLRQTMWGALQELMESNPYISTDGVVECRQDPSSQSGQTPPAKMMMKRHARALLEKANRKRARDGDDEDDAEEDADTGAAAKSTGRPRGVEREEEEDEGVNHQGAPPYNELPHLSDVVKAILPAVPTISSTNTLSPAFLFFSILFLANEHNVVLDNVSTLDDLVVRGFAQKVAH